MSDGDGVTQRRWQGYVRERGNGYPATQGRREGTLVSQGSEEQVRTRQIRRRVFSGMVPC